MNKLLVILGSTATGKTDLGLYLAKKFNGELVAADSRQVYVGLDIGTGKIPHVVGKIKKENGFWEINGVKIWLYDLVNLKKQYTVADYVRDANKVINDIQKRGKLPIIVGGTGLYLRALLDGLNNLAIPVDFSLREELGKLSLEKLQLRIEKISLKRWKNLNQSDRKNPRRLLRSIELASMNPYMQDNKTIGLKKVSDVLKIGLTAPREVLYKNSDFRVLAWFDEDIIKEVDGLVKNGVLLDRLRQLGLEYGILADYLDGKVDRDKLVEIIQKKLHGYIRRQLTWFKKDSDISWFDITTENFVAQVEKLVSSWYDSR